MKRKKKAIVIYSIIAAAILIIAALAVFYINKAMYFNNHFQYQTTINGIDCSRKTVDEVKHIITETIAPYQLELKARDGEIEYITGSEIDLHPVFDNILELELEKRSGYTWLRSLFQKTEIKLETMFAYDEELLLDSVNHLQCVVLSDSRKPVNASLSDYIPEKGYEIIPEEEGAQIDKSILADAVNTSIKELQSQISLEEIGCYLEPEIRSTDETLQSTAAQLNSYLAAAITYEFGDFKEILDMNTIHTWLSLTEDNQVVIDEAQIAAYIEGLASKYDTYGNTRNFVTSYGSTVKLSPNRYGWQMDQAKEKALLLEEIKAGSTVSRAPSYLKRGKTFGSKDYGGTYVEINITAQRLFLYKDGSKIFETDLISGNSELGNDTPSGAYSVTYTQRGATLTGRDYSVPVDFWMPFNGNIGMHDAGWKDDFGGNYYTYTGSHGCINLPYNSAKTIFNTIKTGDPVFVYRLPGTESAKYWLQEKARPVWNMIVSLDNVITLDSKADIEAARAAYDALAADVKPYVWTYDILVQAEADIAVLLDQQEQQYKSAAQVVINAINAIGEVTLESKAAIEGARNQYNALSDTAKRYVTNVDILQNAESRLQELIAQGSGN